MSFSEPSDCLRTGMMIDFKCAAGNDGDTASDSIEKAIRLWNGGVKYTTRATNRYYKKVLAQMK